MAGCASRGMMEACARVDYVGIGWLIATSIATVVHHGYTCAEAMAEAMPLGHVVLYPSTLLQSGRVLEAAGGLLQHTSELLQSHSGSVVEGSGREGGWLSTLLTLFTPLATLVAPLTTALLSLFETAMYHPLGSGASSCASCAACRGTCSRIARGLIGPTKMRQRASDALLAPHPPPSVLFPAYQVTHHLSPTPPLPAPTASSMSANIHMPFDACLSPPSKPSGPPQLDRQIQPPDNPRPCNNNKTPEYRSPAPAPRPPPLGNNSPGPKSSPSPEPILAKRDTHKRLPPAFSQSPIPDTPDPRQIIVLWRCTAKRSAAPHPAPRSPSVRTESLPPRPAPYRHRRPLRPPPPDAALGNGPRPYALCHSPLPPPPKHLEPPPVSIRDQTTRPRGPRPYSHQSPA
ncbi:hypothetical protein B0H11DRAFT_2218337 [Mycena galericulata]|nr:hypothetical protein B0H11DRAFT_2218337 [Mycena galericulata]